MDPCSTKHRLLIVDDSKTLTNVLRVHLMGDEYDFTVAYDGQSGLRHAKELLPKLVIADMYMPLLSGAQLITEMRKVKELADIPVIIVTSKRDPKTLRSAFEAGAYACLYKPIDPEELVGVVHRALA